MNWYQAVADQIQLSPPADEQPLRAELFSVSQLEHHAKALAGLHVLATGVAPDRLIPRLEDNERSLVRTYVLVTAAGFPRVYAIAMELIAHVDGSVDAMGLGALTNCHLLSGSPSTIPPCAFEYRTFIC